MRDAYDYSYLYEMKAIWDLFDEGIYITDSNGNTLEINKSYEAMTGIKRDMLIGRNIKDIVEEGILSNSITEKVMKMKKVVIEHQTVGRTGKHLVIRGNPIYDVHGEINMVLTIVMDQTALKHMRNEISRNEEIIHQYQKELENIKERKKYVANSPKFKRALELAERVGNVNTTVLIRGESGTGKEVIARHIYESGARSEKPFLEINCGAIPENLLESELFGYEPGAFTGAKKNGHKGLFEEANGGTVFLDEIGDMPLMLQVKLLRVLQERTIRRIGSSKDIPIDVRIIAATNCNLEKMIKEKRFREDLYYRLNVVSIELPPLRERKEDIPAFVQLFTHQLNEKYNFDRQVSPQTLKAFMEYDWPGNVRELENKVEQMLVTSECNVSNVTLQNISEKSDDPETIEMIPLKQALEHAEQQILELAAKKYHTTYEIAEALEVSQASISRKLSKYKIKIEQ
mgnify:CR=1 FL=1